MITKKVLNNFEKMIRTYSLEMIHFDEFVLSSLREEGVEIADPVTASSRSRDILPIITSFLPNGIPSIVTTPSLLETAYFDEKEEVDSLFVNNKKSAKRFKTYIVVSLVKEKYVKTFDNCTVYVLGVEFVRELIERHPKEWWIFAATCRSDNNVSYDERTKEFTIKNPHYITDSLGPKIVIKDEDVAGISSRNKLLFKRMIKDRPPALFVGNGASICFGSDLWTPLCDYLFDYLSPKYVENIELVKKAIGNTTFSMSSMSKYLIDKKKYYSAIYSSIYRKFEDSMHEENTLIRSIVKIKEKYPTLPIVTYNYDDFLENDYKIVTGKTISSVASKREDDKTKEPKILHVHGFFPRQDGKQEPNLVLTQEEYYAAYKGQGWTPTVQKKFLEGRVCLFVGSSMSDLYQMSIINEVQKSYYLKQKTTSWKCFALLCLKGMSSKDIVSIYNYYMSKGVYVIYVEDFKELPGELLELFKKDTNQLQ